MAPNDESEIIRWLIEDARQLGEPIAVVDGFCRRLRAAGLPLWRIRVVQRVANPLTAAWGVIWTRDAPPYDYEVPHRLLATAAWVGSPFQTVTRDGRSVRRRLVDLDPQTDHTILHELAAAGGTDYLALPLVYGDSSIQGMSLVSDGPEGFTDAQIALIERLRHALAAALEPGAMRRSTESLLTTYLGRGPAQAVLDGALQRGDRTRLEAAILLADLRDFTDMSERLDEAVLFGVLDTYFAAVVDAVHDQGGDVLKFIGDAVLAVFPVTPKLDRAAACRCAVNAVTAARKELAETFVAALHVGPVAYGNIGSPDRLDFTVIGPAVNLASRLEGVAKSLGLATVCSAAFAVQVPEAATRAGEFELKGVAAPQPVYRVDG